MSQLIRYGSIVLGSVAASFGGVMIAARTQSPADGGRGGAIAVALAFAALFIGRNYGVKLYEAIYADLPKILEEIEALKGSAPLIPNNSTVDDLKRQVEAIRIRLDTEADNQSKQNVALAIASVIGTIAWGFGDMAACWLVTGHFHCPCCS